MINALFTLVALAGVLIILVGQLWLLVRAFQEGILWGLGCLIFPLITLAFLILHWGRAKQPFCWLLTGIGMLFAVAIIAPGAFPGR